MSIENNKDVKDSMIFVAPQGDQTRFGLYSFIFPHLGALKESLEDFIILYDYCCPNEDCGALNQEMEGIVLDLDHEVLLGTNLDENLLGRYTLWCCPRCALALLERKE